MKRFKIEKSRSTLWREAQRVAELQPESDVVGVVNGDEIFGECYPFAEFAADAESRYSVLGDKEGCQSDDCDSEINVENYIGSHWLADDYENNISSRWGVNDDDEDVSDQPGDGLVQDLATWSIKNHITMTATGSLLSLLKPHLPFLPKCAQTLRNTLRDTSHVMKSVRGGEYCHLGLSSGLNNLIIQNCMTTVDNLELQFNVDGIPLFKSSSLTLWPILCLVKNIPFKAPFVVGMFCGNEKPGSAGEFLADFVAETCMLVKEGLIVGKQTKKVTIHSFVCDAPARAFIKGIKYPSGYNSCEKCTVHGAYDRKVIFPVEACPLRTDEAFDTMIDDDHHTQSCPLKPLPLGYVTQFGLDYMHLACLGVMRRLIRYWKGPDGPLEVRLGRRMVCDLSSRLLQLTQFIPFEFARKPRSLDEVLRWKATEFREFMLYTGIVVLKDVLSEKLYNHFLLFFVSMRILVSEQLSKEYCDYAHDLLVKFVNDAQALYGNDILVYNVHCLVHLANDVKNLGCLDNFSAFVFENKLGQLKKLVRKPQQPMQQIIRRLHEEASLEAFENNVVSEPTLQYEHYDGPILRGFRAIGQFKRVKTDKFGLSANTGNNCVLLAGCIPALVRNILQTNDGIVLICEKFVSVQNAFQCPLLMPSTRLNIFRVSGRCRNLFHVSLSDAICKCVNLPLFVLDSAIADDNTFLVLPLLHLMM